MGEEVSSQASGEPLTKLGHSFKEATKITGLGRTTLHYAVQKGKLKCFKIGRRVLFSPEHLKEFMESHEQRPERLRQAHTLKKAKRLGSY